MGGSADHFSSRAHAEGVDSSSGGTPSRQFILRRGKAGLFAILGLIDPALGMLNPKSHGIRFGFHGNPHLMQLTEGISGTVTHGQYQVIGFNPFPMTCLHPSNPAVLDPDSGKRAAEPDLATKGKNFLPKVDDHTTKPICSDMGLLSIEDFLIGTGLVKLHQDLLNPLVFYSGGQLAVRKGTSASFPELYVRLRIQSFILPESFHVPDPFIHRLSSFEDDGL